MRFERTQNPQLIREVLTHPRIWDAISDDFSPAREEFQPAMNEALWYVAVYDGAELLGIFLFVPQSRICWEVHTCLLPHSWGIRATEAAEEVARWIWANTPCRRIITNVPAYNRLALRFAKHAGMTPFGCNERSYQKNGILHDQIMLGLSRK